MRLATLITVAALVLAPACETAKAMVPDSLKGIVAAASGLSGNLSGLLGGLDAGNLMNSQLAPLEGYVKTGKELLGGLDALPADASEGLSLDGLKSALGGVADFDVNALMGAMGSEKGGMLEQLKSAVGSLGQEASSLESQLAG